MIINNYRTKLVNINFLAGVQQRTQHLITIHNILFILLVQFRQLFTHSFEILSDAVCKIE